MIQCFVVKDDLIREETFSTTGKTLLYSAFPTKKKALIILIHRDSVTIVSLTQVRWSRHNLPAPGPDLG